MARTLNWKKSLRLFFYICDLIDKKTTLKLSYVLKSFWFFMTGMKAVIQEDDFWDKFIYIPVWFHFTDFNILLVLGIWVFVAWSLQ